MRAGGAILAWWLFALCGTACAGPPEGAPLEAIGIKCDVGPVERSIAGTHWTAYSCHNRIAVLLVADPGNPVGQCSVFVMQTEIKAYVTELKGCEGRAMAEVSRHLANIAYRDVADIIRQTTSPDAN